MENLGNVMESCGILKTEKSMNLVAIDVNHFCLSMDLFSYFAENYTLELVGGTSS